MVPWWGGVSRFLGDLHSWGGGGHPLEAQPFVECSSFGSVPQYVKTVRLWATKAVLWRVRRVPMAWWQPGPQCRPCA